MKNFILFIILVQLISIPIISQNTYSDIQKMPFNDKFPKDTIRYNFPWLTNYKTENTIVNRIAAPAGFKRLKHPEKSFAHWLQRLPLKEGNPKVYLYDGSPKWNQNAHCYVVDIETGNKDLQQCADAIMRIRAEYLFSYGNKDDIKFNYTNGAVCYYKKWRQGLMPVPKGKEIQWVASSKAGEGYQKFKSYLIQVYNYAGTHSLEKELNKVNFEQMQPGDVIIKGGFPGHGVLVMDMAQNHTTGEKLFILAQSYMPAQDFQILKNPNNSKLSPWYSLSDVKDVLKTPEWNFSTDDLRRW
jgi:hypothetical protein